MIRGVGGTVEDVTLVVGDQPEWTTGSEYLVFLKYRQTPLQEGTEGAWTEAVLGQSTFVFDRGEWKNEVTGLTITLDELAE